MIQIFFLFYLFDILHINFSLYFFRLIVTRDWKRCYQGLKFFLQFFFNFFSFFLYFFHFILLIFPMFLCKFTKGIEKLGEDNTKGLKNNLLVRIFLSQFFFFLFFEDYVCFWIEIILMRFILIFEWICGEFLRDCSRK